MMQKELKGSMTPYSEYGTGNLTSVLFKILSLQMTNICTILVHR